MDFTILIKVALGVESVTAFELETLGYPTVEKRNGELTLRGNELDVAKLNLGLRTAERVYIEIARYVATDFDLFFDQARDLPWKEFFPKDARINIQGSSVRSKLTSVRTAQAMLKKAIVLSLGDSYGLDKLPETGATYEVEFFIQKDEVVIGLNTSGEGLHRRGYRTEGGQAPLRETLAAAVVYLAGYESERTFADPLCGSGTLAIEAALIAKNFAPGLRRHFLAESWPIVPAPIWKEAREFFISQTVKKPAVKIFASDRNSDVISQAKRNCERAGVGDLIAFEVVTLQKFKTPARDGIWVSNLPYGERLGTPEQLKGLYGEIQEFWRANPDWESYLLTADETFERQVKRRAAKKRKLYNAKIRTDLYQFLP